MLLNNAASAKVQKYREVYEAIDRHLTTSDITSTSGSIHDEFLRLLHILSHRQAVKFFDEFGGKPPENAFSFCCAAYLHNQAALGLACAQATAIRTHVAPNTVRRPFHAPTPRERIDPLFLLSILTFHFEHPTLLPLPVLVQCVLKNGDSHKTGYTGCSLSYVNSGITAASSTTEPRSTGSRRHCTVREVYCTLAGVDRVIMVNTTAQL